MSTIIAVISDTHTGSTVGLAPPTFTTHTGRDKKEEQLSQYNKYQEWLYECWRHYWTTVYTMAGVRGNYRTHRLLFWHLGDVVDGDHHGTCQIMPEVGDQIEAACNILRPIVATTDGTWITYGTGAHNGGAAEHETTIGRELGAHFGYEFSLSVDGYVFDLAHEGRSGRRDYSSLAAGVAEEVARDYQKDGKMAPRFTLRGHTHKVDDSGYKHPDTRAIILPSWQLRSFYGHKVSPNQKRNDIGGLIIDTADIDNPHLLRYAAPGGFIQTEEV